MDIISLLESLAGLVAILAILIFIFLYSPFQKKKIKKHNQKKKSDLEPIILEHDFDSILKVIRDKHSTSKELSQALDLLLKYHGNIPHKLGMRTNPEFDKYSEVILRLCRHPNTNKELIINLDKELQKKNPKYVKEINDSLTKGLNSRGA